jgi:hypothetical protein
MNQPKAAANISKISHKIYEYGEGEDRGIDLREFKGNEIEVVTRSKS